jgi:hypothetical protein
MQFDEQTKAIIEVSRLNTAAKIRILSPSNRLRASICEKLIKLALRICPEDYTPSPVSAAVVAVLIERRKLLDDPEAHLAYIRATLGRSGE